MPLTVLNVAYCFAPVGPDAVGGAESVLTHIDEALTRRGHRSLVVACEGSRISGELVPVFRCDGAVTDAQRRRVHQEQFLAIKRILERERVDVVHLHGVDFLAYLPPPGVPVLVTLHLPIKWYPPEVFTLGRPETHLHCVSAAQRRSCDAHAPLWSEIENGVPVELMTDIRRKRAYVMSLGRICPEKGFHLALDAARDAGAAMALGGRVFAYAEHQRYFEQEIAPRLDTRRRFVGPVSGARKYRLLGAARALLVPSLAPETSSLVAMEAMACGTPVIAFRNGALPEIVDHGRTGFVVDTVAEMSAAIRACEELDPEVCRRLARQRFSSERMTARYLETYEGLAHGCAGCKEAVHAA